MVTLDGLSDVTLQMMCEACAGRIKTSAIAANNLYLHLGPNPRLVQAGLCGSMARTPMICLCVSGV